MLCHYMLLKWTFWKSACENKIIIFNRINEPEKKLNESKITCSNISFKKKEELIPNEKINGLNKLGNFESNNSNMKNLLFMNS